MHCGTHREALNGLNKAINLHLSFQADLAARSGGLVARLVGMEPGGLSPAAVPLRSMARELMATGSAADARACCVLCAAAAAASVLGTCHVSGLLGEIQRMSPEPEPAWIAAAGLAWLDALAAFSSLIPAGPLGQGES